ncbi:hypothetical protein BD779DRAFT_708071 [Infundibulicybe gibba]|nr:hypothetical protein BD779DRAFT_708071 [Infundibulicybe gibba]
MAMTSAYTAALVYSNWREYKELTSRPGSQVKTNPDVFSLSILIRLALFFIVIVVAVCLDASTQMLGPMTEGRLIWGIMVGSVPLATVLIFGTHRDMMRTWASWLRIYTWC